jgi:signal transduction histidine kinase
MGIPADEQDFLFERFFRTSTATEQAIQGTGLGLAISKAIVEAHAGRITVASEEGAGTTFRVSLPIQHEAELPERTEIAS